MVQPRQCQARATCTAEDTMQQTDKRLSTQMAQDRECQARAEAGKVETV